MVMGLRWHRRAALQLTVSPQCLDMCCRVGACHTPTLQFGGQARDSASGLPTVVCFHVRTDVLSKAWTDGRCEWPDGSLKLAVCEGHR